MGLGLLANDLHQLGPIVIFEGHGGDCTNNGSDRLLYNSGLLFEVAVQQGVFQYLLSVLWDLIIKIHDIFLEDHSGQLSDLDLGVRLDQWQEDLDTLGHFAVLTEVRGGLLDQAVVTGQHVT